MKRDRTHRLHNSELRDRIAYWQHLADLRVIEPVSLRWWQRKRRREALDGAKWCQTVADELTMALKGGRGK